MENVSDRAPRAGHGILLGHSKWVFLVALLGLLLAFFGAPREAQAAGYAVNFGGSATGVGTYLVSGTAADSAGNSYITGSFDALSTIIGG
ncbi:MAG: hypothetical protein WCI05_04295 [Myxococcales bacterium]